MNKIGIYSSHHKDPDGKLISEVFTRLTDDYPDMVIIKVYSREDVQDLDLLLVLGGDGTLLSAARLSYGSQVPLLGVNIGTVGFMTGTDQKGLKEALLKINEGKYTIEDRMMLETTMHCAEGDKTFQGLNDIVIHKGALANIIYFEMFVDGNFATSYRGDGLIITTPTGSTAYNLSAGGSIMYPTVELMGVTAICPHTFGIRNLILSSHQEVKIKITKSNESYFLSVDGQENLEISEDAVITTTKAKYPCKVLRLDDYDYFDVLRQKLIYKAMNIERGQKIED